MSDRLSQEEPLLVCKRDGTHEPFSLAKLQGSIRNGLQAGDEAAGQVGSTAAGLAEAVYEYVKRSCRDGPVEAKLLSELVELVLAQTGMSAACLAFQRHRSFRVQQRRRLMVASQRPSDGRFVRRRWKKSLIVQHLRRRHGLGTPVARLIAGRVEQIAFNCGLNVVTVGLVCETVKSELLAWGLLPGALVVKKTRQNAHHSRRVKNKSDTG